VALGRCTLVCDCLSRVEFVVARGFREGRLALATAGLTVIRFLKTSFVSEYTQFQKPYIYFPQFIQESEQFVGPYSKLRFQNLFKIPTFRENMSADICLYPHLLIASVLTITMACFRLSVHCVAISHAASSQFSPYTEIFLKFLLR
jgi:hypothetical protein